MSKEEMNFEDMPDQDETVWAKDNQIDEVEEATADLRRKYGE